MIQMINKIQDVLMSVHNQFMLSQGKSDQDLHCIPFKHSRLEGVTGIIDN